MVVYLLQITVNLVLTYVIYKWALENIKTYRFNRFYLLFSIILSLLLPLFSISYNTSLPELQTGITEISAIIIRQNEGTTPAPNIFFSWTILLYAVYFSGLGIGLFRFSRGILFLTSLKKQGKQVIENGQRFVLLTNVKHPFTFGKTIYLPENTAINNSNPIILHEKVHVNQKHSLDILLLELLQCVFWFHPIFSFFKKSIALNHEFLADDEVTAKQVNTADYLKLLLNQTYESNEIPLSSSFNFNLTKKRFTMITKKDHPIKNALSITLACAVLTLTGVASTQAQEKKTESQQTVAAVQVDEQAKPTEGMLKFQQYVISSFKVDTTKIDFSQEKTMIILQFNVETDGSIVDVEILRSNVGEEANEVMLDILKNSKKWKPAKIDGKAVKSQFTLPITILTDDTKTASK